MQDSFDRFGGLSAILVGLLSILYAVFFLVVSQQAKIIGSLGSWLILGGSGIFSSAAFVALYRRLRSVSEGQALWALLVGVGSSLATLMHGAFEAMLVGAGQTAGLSQVDPAGLASFFLLGLVAFAFSHLILRGGAFPPRLGYLGMLQAALVIILFFANVAGGQTVILISGGLASVIVGPIWWIGLGRELLKSA